MSLFSASQPPISAPGPCTKLTCPEGMPASSRISHSFAALKGVACAGLITTVLPEASAGATLCATTLSGELNEVMLHTTPRGTRMVNAIRCDCPGAPSIGTTSP